MPPPPTPPTPPFHPGCYCYRDEAAAAARSAGLIVRCGGGLPCMCLGTSSNSPLVLDDEPNSLPHASAEISPASKSSPSLFHSLDSLLDPNQQSLFPPAPLPTPQPPIITPTLPASNSLHLASAANLSVTTKRPRPPTTCACPCAEMHRAAAAKARKCCGGECTCPPGACKCDLSTIWTQMRCCGENAPNSTDNIAANFPAANAQGATGCCGVGLSARGSTSEVGRNDLFVDLAGSGDGCDGVKGTAEVAREFSIAPTGLTIPAGRRAPPGVLDVDGRLNERRRGGQPQPAVINTPVAGGGSVGYAGVLGKAIRVNANSLLGINTAAQGVSAPASCVDSVASFGIPDFGLGVTEVGRGVGHVEVHQQALANYTADLLSAPIPTGPRGVFGQHGAGVYSVTGETATPAANMSVSKSGDTNGSTAIVVVEKCASCGTTSLAKGRGTGEDLKNGSKQSDGRSGTLQESAQVEDSVTKSGEGVANIIETQRDQSVANGSSDGKATAARGSSLDLGNTRATTSSAASMQSGPSGARGRGRRRRSSTYHGGESRDRTFACTLCPSTFFFKQNRDRHINEVHLGKRPHKCEFPGCKGAFKNRSGLKQHVRTVHEKARPFKCDKCESTFGQRNHLTQHVLVVHDKVKMFQCEFCGMSFSNVGNRTQHIRRKHSNAKPRTEDGKADASSAPATRPP